MVRRQYIKDDPAVAAASSLRFSARFVITGSLVRWPYGIGLFRKSSKLPKLKKCAAPQACAAVVVENPGHAPV
jgi:hypothetical protein